MQQKTSEISKSSIKENLNHTLQRIKSACHDTGRNPDEVRLMLVTKTVPAENIQVALEEGELLLGENRSDDLKKTHEKLNTYHPEIHFIGHLMESELDNILPYADCVQTVDNIEIAREMDQKLNEMGKKMDILIQVNTSRRDSPFGITPAHVIGLALKISKLENLTIRGLMTLGVFDASQEKAQSCFQLLKNLHDEILLLDIPGIQLNTLSMGMSKHLETAIAEGSTMVRVGTAIFGERETPDSYYWKE